MNSQSHLSTKQDALETGGIASTQKLQNPAHKVQTLREKLQEATQGGRISHQNQNKLPEVQKSTNQALKTVKGEEKCKKTQLQQQQTTLRNENSL